LNSGLEFLWRKKALLFEFTESKRVFLSEMIRERLEV